ncbi:MAG: glycosyltransferase [bacterium]|nr:glycosyltransferase [bacterium]
MTAPEVDVLMITFRRPHYTEMSLARLLDSVDESVRVWVWHNGEDAETLDVVRSFEDHPRFHRLHVSPENQRLRAPTNWLWENAEGAYLSKVDDDCLVPERWVETLREAHEAEPRFGVVGCWRFQDEDFLPNVAGPKIETFSGGHRLLRNCWVQGSGYLMKRECVEELGLLGEEYSFTRYCIRLAERGWLNGFYFPFLKEDHMDDPRSPNSDLRSDQDLVDFAPLGAQADGVIDLEAWKKRVRWNARMVQEAPLDPRWFSGWRRRLYRIKAQWLRRGA